jgi:dipeptidyl aminopeptidase/acylaminoacyl peptidase
MNWFDPESQTWIDHGFAFLTLNYRGSTTFGRDFQEKIWGDFGHWEVEDMAAAHAWLVQQGIAQADQIFLTGWSYGGYLTLLGLGKRPELWAGGMAGAAITDWRLNYEDQADTLRGYTVLALGGTPDEAPARYAASSPLSYAAQVNAPILIIQGRNDTRTPPRQVEIYATKLRELGKSITVHWHDTGHAGGEVELGLQHQELMLQFARSIVRNGIAT